MELRELVNGGQLFRLEVVYTHILNANRRLGNLEPSRLSVRKFIYLPPGIAPGDHYATVRWGCFIFTNAVVEAIERIDNENRDSEIAEAIDIMDDYENRVRGADGAW